jgi:hypothetical protein
MFWFCRKVIAESRTHMHIDFEGGDRLKFGDVVTAVASLTIIASIISFPLTTVLTPALGSYNAFELTTFVSLILSPIIVGYIFAQKIWEEDKTKIIAKISVLFAVLSMFMVLIENSIVEWAPMFRADYLKVNPTATPSAFEWYNIELSALSSEVFLVVVLVLALTFIGLYIGSMLKKPKKS